MTEAQGKSELSEMPLLEHLEELRQRLIRVFVSILIFAIVTYIFADYLLEYLVKPMGTVYFRDPTGAFMVRLKLSFAGGILCSVLVILYHFWRFVSPGLYKHEIRSVLPVILFGTLFFFGGAAFCYLLVIPIALSFLQSFATESIQPWIDIKEYFSFVIYLCLAFGVVFELPVVSYFLGRVGIITSRFLIKGRRFALLFILIAGALLTPPDIFSQLALAIPLYLLYEVSIIVVKLTGRREPRQQQNQSDGYSENDLQG
jgi:sec-independent protein translocase protein TatC